MSSDDSGVLLGVARQAARIAATELAQRVGRVAVLRAKSSPTDPVTEADEAAESAVRSFLASTRPDDAVLGEEGGEDAGVSGLRWVIDPLDGTVNYLYGHPQWCVSVAVEDPDGPLAGVVLDVLRDEEFSAVRGGAAMLDGVEFERPGRQPIGDDPLNGVLLATGFHYEASVRELQAEVFSGLIPRVRDIRRGGSAALDLCWAAIGRVDAYAEHGVREWDVAAGGLICRAAGLDVELLPTPGWPVGMAVGEPGVVAELAGAFGCGGPGRSWPRMRLG